MAVYTVSYDDQEAIADFVAANGIGYTMLADPGSAVIERIGLLNTLVPEGEAPWYGIAYPGFYVIGSDGIIEAKFFESNVQRRVAVDELLDVAAGRELDATALVNPDQISEGQLTLSAELEGGRLVLGTRHRLVIRIDPPPGFHLYGPGVPAELVPVEVAVDDVTGLEVGPVVMPETRDHDQLGYDDPLPVFDGPVVISVGLRVDSNPFLAASGPSPTVPIGLSVRVQACDDAECLLPQTLSWSTEVVVEGLVAPTLDPDVETRERGAHHFARLRSRSSSTDQ